MNRDQALSLIRESRARREGIIHRKVKPKPERVAYTVDEDGAKRRPDAHQVPGEGPEGAKIMFVGEAPGEHEEREGRPFVGPAGKLFNTMLEKAGIDRTECYVTNVVPERPGVKSNDIKSWCDLSKTVPVVSADFLSYRDVLVGKIICRRPNVVVPLGATALWALTGRKDITKVRGSILPSVEHAPDRVVRTKVIPLVHPSWILRGKYVGSKAGERGMQPWFFRYYTHHDLLRVKREAQRAEFSEKPVLHTRCNLSQLGMSRLLELPIGPIAIDIETACEEVSCISLSNGMHTASIAFTSIEEQGHIFSEEKELDVWLQIGRLLESQTPKIFHNASYDVSFLAQRYGFDVRAIDDSMVMTAVLHPEFPYGLDFVTSLHTDYPYYKDQGRDWFKYLEGSEEQFWRYNALDALCCHDAAGVMRERLQRKSFWRTYQRQVALVRPLCYMQERGMLVDLPRLGSLKKEYKRKVGELERAIVDQVQADRVERDPEDERKPINPRSNPQLIEYFYTDGRYPAYKTRGTGRPTVDGVALTRLKAKGSEVAELLLEQRSVEKLSSTYFSVKLDKDKRLRCAMNPVGTLNGRPSSSKTLRGTGLNFFNLPQAMKNLILADEGYVLYEADLSQAELVCMAYMAPVTQMVEAFQEGKDLHRLTAAKVVYLKPEEEITKEERHAGKTCNHALNYGMGANTFALAHGLTIPEARMRRLRYLDFYPGVAAYWRRVESELRSTRTLDNPFGRKREFLGSWNDELLKAAYNWRPQSTVGDLINEALVEAFDAWPRPEVEILNYVYDSILFQVRLDAGWARHEEVLEQLIAWLRRPIRWRDQEFRIEVDLKLGRSWGGLMDVEGHSQEELGRVWGEVIADG